jgi:hypothetical protein
MKEVDAALDVIKTAKFPIPRFAASQFIARTLYQSYQFCNIDGNTAPTAYLNARPE